MNFIIKNIKIIGKQFIVISLLLSGLLVFSGIDGLTQNKKTVLQNNKKKLEEEIAMTSKLLSETRKNRELTVSQVNILNVQIKKREELINSINSEVVEIDGEISSNQANIQKYEGDLKQLKAGFSKMIYYAYKTRKSHERLMFLFSAKDFNQAFRRLKYLQIYVQYIKSQVILIKQVQSEINEANMQLVEARNNKAQLMGQQVTEKMKLTKTTTEKTQAINKLKKKEADLRNTIKQKEKAAKQLQATINKLIENEIKASAKKAGTKSTPNAITLAPDEVALSKDFGANKGRLPWPIEKGFISNTFGSHPHPVLAGIVVKNDGLNFTTSKGGAVRAIFEGKVTAVTSIPSFNNVVMIRHGEYLTVYANLAGVSVGVGDKVKTKQTIGTVSFDSQEGNAVLHFELRKGTTILNPADWLVK